MSEEGPVPHLVKLQEAERNNFAVSVQNLGADLSIVADFADAYHALTRLLRRTKDPPDHLHAVSLLFLSAAYQFDRGTLDCLRGYLTDGVQHTRRAIEAAGFAVRIAMHPHLAGLWFEASPADDTYAKYREKFSPSKLFPKADSLLAKLGERWDSASRQSHTSLSSLAGRASLVFNEDSVAYDFQLFEVSDEDESGPMRCLLWILDVHFGVLLAFERAFSDQLGIEMPAWEVRRNALDAKLEGLKAKWRDRILGADPHSQDGPS